MFCDHSDLKKLYIYIYIFKKYIISVSSTGKVSNSCIRYLGFNFCIHQKLWSDDKKLSSEANTIDENFLSKKNKK